MSKITRILILSSVFLIIGGCVAQKPTAQAPVYNVTVTDNSQYVIGDNNKAESRPETTADQVAKPDVAAQAKSAGSTMWLFWLGFVLGIAAIIAGYLIYIRYFKQRGWNNEKKVAQNE